MTDFLLRPDGTKVSGVVVATYVITDIPGIRQIQFVQRDRASVEVNLVRGPGWSECALGILESRLRSFLGRDLQLTTVFRESIPLEKSGKHRFSIFSVQPPA